MRSDPSPPTSATTVPSRREFRWLHWAIGLYVAVALAFAVKVATQGERHTVYPQFRLASAHWWSGQSLYAEYPGIDIYRYSPAFAVLFSPFALLPSAVGQIAWNWLSIALLFWSLRVFVRTVLPVAWSEPRESAFLALALVPMLRGIWSAHSNALVISLAMLAAAAVARRRWWTASALLVTAVYIKLWPVALLMLLAACWPRQLLPRVALPAALLASLPFLTRPASVVVWQYAEWWTSLTVRQQERWPAYRDLWTVWEHLAPPVHVSGYVVLQLSTALGVLAWCLWQRRRHGDSPRLLLLILAAWTCWQLLAGPATERMTYGILAPISAWALLASLADGRGRIWAGVAWAVILAFSSGSTERALMPWCPAAPVLLPLGVLLFAGWLAWRERGHVASHEPVFTTKSDTTPTELALVPVPT